jgi:hypothetical protein
MNKDKNHKKLITSDQADFIISKALKEDIGDQMPDEMFDRLWDNAQKTQIKPKTIQIKFYAVAAAIALMVTLSGIWFHNQSQIYMQKQYEQSAMALNKVSKYLNMGLAKLDHVEQYNEAVQHLELLKKPEKKVKKLEYINKLPIVIE